MEAVHWRSWSSAKLPGRQGVAVGHARMASSPSARSRSGRSRKRSGKAGCAFTRTRPSESQTCSSPARSRTSATNGRSGSLIEDLREEQLRLLDLPEPLAGVHDPLPEEADLPPVDERVLGVEPDPRQSLLEGALVGHQPQDQVELPHNELEHPDLVLEQLQDVGLDGARGGQVEDVDVALLAQAVQAPDALLQPHRVPGEV